MEKIIFVEEEVLYQEYYEKYQGLSLVALVDRKRELQSVVGSDPVEIRALNDLINETQCDMDPYEDYK
ncbi:MAG: hypothetical protein J6Y53_04210 [Alphaproteobacteria bacterium]|nr:hypothetical protein [Alphaproteobacteria bacterium]